MLPPDVPSWGSLSLGFFIAYLVWYFVTRFPAGQFTAAGLTSVVAVVAGGVVEVFLDVGGGSVSAPSHWWYPIGLIVGFVVYELAYIVVHRRPAAFTAFAQPLAAPGSDDPRSHLGSDSA
jgi:hypothetical protein